MTEERLKADITYYRESLKRALAALLAKGTTVLELSEILDMECEDIQDILDQ